MGGTTGQRAAHLAGHKVSVCLEAMVQADELANEVAGPHSNTVSTATRTLSAPSTRTEVDPSIATGQQYLTYGYESPQNAQPEPYQMSIAWPGSYGPPQTATEQHEGVPMYDPSQDGGGQSMQLQPYWPAGAIQGVGVPIDDGTEEYWVE